MSRDTRAGRRSAQLALAAGAALCVPLGLAAKAGDWRWARDHGAGAVYETFWVLAILALLPRLAPARVAAGVFAVTAALEALQLWHPPWLAAARGTWLGGALLGSTFGWLDLPYYAIGCMIGWALARAALGR